MCSVYSSEERERPARTSSEELVTPPGKRRCEDTITSEREVGRHTLVGTRVLEENNLALLKEQSSLLSDEQIRALDDIFEMGFALRVNETSNIRDVHSLRSTKVRT